MDLLERMLGYDRWTTDRLLTMCRDLPDAQLDREFDIGNRTIRKTFDHVLAAMELWTGLMAGERRGRSEPTHASVHDRFDAVGREVAAAGWTRPSPTTTATRRATVPPSSRSTGTTRCIVARCCTCSSASA